MADLFPDSLLLPSPAPHDSAIHLGRSLSIVDGDRGQDQDPPLYNVHCAYARYTGHSECDGYIHCGATRGRGGEEQVDHYFGHCDLRVLRLLWRPCRSPCRRWCAQDPRSKQRPIWYISLYSQLFLSFLSLVSLNRIWKWTGRQRMFGSISFGVASSLVGFITDWANDMNAIFYVYVVSAVCFILVAGSTQFKPERLEGAMRLVMPTHLTAPPPPVPPLHGPGESSAADLRTKVKQFQFEQFEEEEDDEDDGEEPQMRQNEIQRLIQFATESSIIEAVNLSNPPAYRRRLSNVDELDPVPARRMPTNVWELVKQPRVILFFTTMMLMGASLNMVISFLFIFLKQDLGASSSTVGLTGLVGSFTELLFFFYSRDVSTYIKKRENGTHVSMHS